MKTKYVIGLLGTVGVASMTFAMSAMAQDATSIGEVVVTGSRVIKDSTKSPTPLTIVSTDQLKELSSATVPDALNMLPVFQGSQSQRNNGTPTPANVVSLRNFGAQRTLVLFDGHRVSPSSAAGTASIDVLPQMLLSRVDVVTGGASAVYGSDAITGVVNFVLDKNFKGLKLEANVGTAQGGYGRRHQVGAAFGTSLFDGRGHFEASLRNYESDEVPMADLPYGPASWLQVGNGSAANPFRMVRDTRTARSSSGGVITCFPANQPGCAALNGTLQFVGTGVVGPFVHGTPSGTAGLEVLGDGAWGARTSAQAGLETNEVFARFSYDFTDSIKGYVNVSGSESKNRAIFYNTETRTNAETFFDSNPFLPASFAALLPGDRFNVAKDWTNFDRFSEWALKSDTKFWQINSGLNGSIGPLDWDLYYTHGETHVAVQQPNNNDLSKYFAAADAVINPANGQIVCQVSLTPSAGKYPGCVPLNLFGPNATTPAMFAYINTATQYFVGNILDDVGGSATREVFALPAGPLRVAVSGEYRKLNYRVDSNYLPSDVVDCTDLRLCVPNVPRWAQGVSAATNKTQDVWELALEATVPVIKNKPLIDDLSLNLAGRHTNYSASGGVNTWKVGVDYHVNSNVRFRGTASVDIRAPTLNDLFQPPTLGSTGYFDIHTGVQAQTQSSTQGNPDLVPEEARTYTMGVVVTPSFVRGFNVSLDYYQITLNNAIGTLGATNTQIAQLCEDSKGAADVCSLWLRPLPFSDHSSANYPTRIFTKGLNAAYQKIQGWDFEANYHFGLASLVGGAPGDIALRFLANYQPTQETIQFVGAAKTVTPNPKTRITATMSYRDGPWRVSLTDRWLDSYAKASLATQVYLDPTVPSFNQVDIQIARDFKIMHADMNAFVQVENIFDPPPPLYTTLTSNPGFNYPVPNSYPIFGRYITVGLRAKF